MFLRLATTPVARAWSGVGGFALPPDSRDPTGGRYLGVGWLRNWPELESLINGVSEEVSLILSGVDPRTIDLVDAVEGVEGVRADLGVMFFGPRWKRGPVRWMRRMRVDMVSYDEKATEGFESAVGVEASVTLTLGSALTSRRRTRPNYWDHATRQRLHPGDMGFSRVGGYGPDATRPWPPKA